MSCNNKTFLESIGPCIDKVRSIHDNFGTRPYKVYILTKEWSEHERGLGQLIERSKLLLEPTPKIERYNDINSRWEACGEVFDGTIKISEISLNYLKEQLSPTVTAYQQKEVFIEFKNHNLILTIDFLTYDSYKAPGWTITSKVREVI